MKFGPGWLDPFERSPSSLRFELGGELFPNQTQPVARFSQAYDRARAVADHVFASSSRLVGVVLWFDDDAGLAGQPRPPGLVSLRAAGFETGAPIATWDEVPPWLRDVEDEDVAGHWAAYDLSRRDQRDVLLWCAISDEMSIGPDAAVTSYIVDPDADLALHVYDDRGMDLIGLTPDTVRDAYGRFDGWLLDYDRPRMRRIFETSAG